MTGGLVAWYRYEAPGLLDRPVTLVVPRGEGATEIARRLSEAGVIAEPMIFRLGARLDGAAARFKAGEYVFEPNISPRAAAALIASGRVYLRRLTIPEGLTVAQAVALITAAPGLDGETGTPPAEGTLLPDTYFYSWGDSRARMIERQKKAMADALADLWPKRASGLPLKTPEDALVLASIVERETAKPEERARVAAVFLNRLKRGMRLQADPTVAYGVAGAQGTLDRPLSRADLETPHPWNTYLIDGLPPTPIANPGRAAIEAALNPIASDELYFAADGSGGHVFARTLAEHNRNVARLRALERSRATKP